MTRRTASKKETRKRNAAATATAKSRRKFVRAGIGMFTDKHSREMEATDQRLVAIGRDDRDIETSYALLWPDTTSIMAEYAFIGYRAFQTFDVEIRVLLEHCHAERAAAKV